MGDTLGLPQGFTLDHPLGNALPQGFTLDVSGDPTAAGIPGNFPEFTREEARAITLERRGPDPLSRIGSAFTAPFEATEFGLSRETVDRFKQTPIPLLNTFNEVIVGGGVGGGLAALQSIGALAEGGISAIKQAAIELGADVSAANTFERNANALAETVGIVTATAPFAGQAGLRNVTQRFPGERQRIFDEANLQVRVPLTRGDVTQDVNIQSFEDEVIQGLHGTQAQARLKTVRQEQDLALRKNIEEIQKEVSGRPFAATAEEAGLGAGRAGGALRDARSISKQVISQAYDRARTFDASVDGEALQAFGPAARQRLVGEGFDVVEMPKLSKRLDEIENLKLVDGKLSEPTLNNIEVLRKRIVKNIESVKVSDPSEAQALRTLKRDLDNHVEEVFNQGLIRGNEEAINVWKRARRLRTEFADTFDADNVIKKISTESLNQEEVLNLLFGGSQMGFKAQAGRNIANIKRILGPNSDAFKSMKEEAILRLVKNQSDSVDFSGAKFNTAVEKAFKNNQTLMKELFTTAELGDIRTFSRLAKQITTKQAGAVNQSQTFNKLARFVAVSKVPVLGQMFDFLVKFKGERQALSRIESNITNAQTIAQFRRDPAIFQQAIATTLATRGQNE